MHQLALLLLLLSLVLSMLANLRVAVLGAGVAGPTVAMLLKQNLGCTPTVFEASHAIKEARTQYVLGLLQGGGLHCWHVVDIAFIKVPCANAEPKTESIWLQSPAPS